MNISVVIPTLNEEKYIGECLKSLRKQTINAEIIVVDSNSKDKTVEIAKKHADKVLVGKKGIAVNRQKGAEVASGEIIVSADADCVYPMEWLKKLTKYFDDPEVVCVSGQTLPMPEESNILDFLCYFTANVILKVANDVFHKPLFRGSTTAYRKKTLEKAGGYNLKLKAREDSELTKRIGAHGKAVFDMRIKAYTSMRRRHELGWLKTLRYYLDTPISWVTGEEYYEKV